MRPKAVIFSVSFVFVLAILLLSVPQDASASRASYVARETADIAGGDQNSYFVYFITEGQTQQVISSVYVKGQVFILGSGSVDGLYVMVTLEDPNGVEYLDLTNAGPDGIFEAEFSPQGNVAGIYTVRAAADATEERRVDDVIQIELVPPPPEPKEKVDPLIYVQAGALVAAFASMAVAASESAGFSLFNIFAFPLYSRIKKEEVLDHFVRGQIYGFIVSNPGEHYNSIREKLKVTNGTLSYHLRTLEVQGFIKSRKESIYRRFYPIDMRYPRDKGVKLSDLQIAILELTRRKPAPTQKDISSELDISQQVASYNLKILARKGYVQVRKEGRSRMYYQIDSKISSSL